MAVLYYAQDVFIPLALAIVISLLLRPAVKWLYRRRVPQVVGAILCLAAVLLVIVAIILPLLGPAQQWISDFPQHMKDASAKLRIVRDKMEQWVRFRTKIEELAAGENQAASPPVPVTVREPELTSSAGVLTATGAMAGMWLAVLVLTFFLLIEGDSLLNSVLKVMPTFRQKRHVVELIKDIEAGVSSYLGTVTLINIGLGAVIALVLWIMGVPNAPLWGLMTTIFNYVPFVGQGLAGIIIGLVALLSFDSFGYALLVPVAFYSIAAVEGNIITPALLGRRMSLNPILVIVSLMIWGWMWGIAGAALAVPILAMLKIALEHFEVTTPSASLPRL
jgi:predicted PurR-regulated permease PerM